ncbi:MAG: indole-3-glycerol phosphate synthase TrpC [Thermodesulfobacteriota bacterium]|jgi:indole-3-glycerol phosphate synthase
MHSKMKEIVAHKQIEVEALRRRGVPAVTNKDLPPLRDFRAAISVAKRIGVIAEIKFASPSAGAIREKIDPCTIGRIYEEAGAAAISLLTDSRVFGGSLSDLPLLKKAVSLPILRKDFIIDEIQLRESRFYGADAVLLIAGILTKNQLKELIVFCKELGLTPLTEIHDHEDLEKAYDCGAEVIGINNRNLESFEVTLRTTLDLARLIPKDRVLVSESGISNKEDIQLLRKSGIRAVLVGTSLMKSKDMAKKTRELVNCGKQMGEPDGGD